MAFVNLNNFYIKMVVVCVPFVVGVGLACLSFFGHSHNLWTGFGYLITSVAVSFFLLRWLVWGDLNLANGSAIATIGGGLGLIGILAGSNIIDPAFIQVRTDLQESFLDASLNCKGNKTLFDGALTSCLAATSKDALALGQELIKARYLAPTLSLADGVYHSSDEAKADACLVNYYLLSKECPSSFIEFNKKHPEVANPSANNK
ncbi:hypothetical protein [Enterobacter bugandensis]|uniref:hypothetical protein n=1 Tax=Enterobacter bugandensis TaxID=881260 RepID=UPI0010A451C3|nr:hypothetical protein [Enterobacter bugandensis]QCE29057.1 hypothetical protein FAI37_17255 [Enterobacter bugandensis]